MKNTFAIVAAIAGLVSAQQINVDAINAAPAPSVTAAPVGAANQGDIAYNSSGASSSASAAAQDNSSGGSSPASAAVQARSGHGGGPATAVVEARSGRGGSRATAIVEARSGHGGGPATAAVEARSGHGGGPASAAVQARSGHGGGPASAAVQARSGHGGGPASAAVEARSGHGGGPATAVVEARSGRGGSRATAVVEARSGHGGGPATAAVEARSGHGGGPATAVVEARSGRGGSRPTAVVEARSGHGGGPATAVVEARSGHGGGPATAVAQAKRDQCAQEPAGTGPAVHNPDTPQAFEDYQYFAYEANSQAYPYDPYPYAETFHNLNGSTQQNSYLTYYVLDSYNTTECAAYCDKVKLCTAFNIYFERDPSEVPGAKCPNPASVTNIKCSLWGSSVSAATATNTGQYQDQFEVVIAGSNGYDKTPIVVPTVTVPYFNLTANISGSTISTSQQGVFLTYSFFAGPYDPSVCGVFAQAQTKANRDAAVAQNASTYQPANFFNAYTAYKNEFAQGTYCSLYTTPVDASYAANASFYSGNDYFNVGASWTYTLSEQDNGEV